MKCTSQNKVRRTSCEMGCIFDGAHDALIDQNDHQKRISLYAKSKSLFFKPKQKNIFCINISFNCDML